MGAILEDNLVINRDCYLSYEQARGLLVHFGEVIVELRLRDTPSYVVKCRDVTTLHKHSQLQLPLH